MLVFTCEIKQKFKLTFFWIKPMVTSAIHDYEELGFTLNIELSVARKAYSFTKSYNK